MQVAAVNHDHREQTVHNLTIATSHTYYAYAGNIDVLTHNCPGVAANGGMRSIEDLLRPGGQTIGKPGTDDTIREITGGLPEAQTMFQQLTQGGTIVAQTPKLTRVELPNGGGFIQLRTMMTRSPNTAATIDVNIPGFDVRKLKYNP